MTEDAVSADKKKRRKDWGQAHCLSETEKAWLFALVETYAQSYFVKKRGVRFVTSAHSDVEDEEEKVGASSPPWGQCRRLTYLLTYSASQPAAAMPQLRFLRKTNDFEDCASQ